jgi:hypothetical protein
LKYALESAWRLEAITANNRFLIKVPRVDYAHLSTLDLIDFASVFTAHAGYRPALSPCADFDVLRGEEEKVVSQ